MKLRLTLGAILLAAIIGVSAPPDSLESGFRNPPLQARPHTYWLWLNGYVDPETARTELRAMKDAGFSGVLMFDMGARGDKSLQPPAGPAFLSPPWMKQFQESVKYANSIGLQFDFSVISSWDLGGHWIEPHNASMGLYHTEATVNGGSAVDVELPFPPVTAAAPKDAAGKPAFWFNRLIGDAKKVGKPITRTNVSVSGGKPWASLEPLDSGLFGPVRLVRY
jgi:hypothetical protein